MNPILPWGSTPRELKNRLQFTGQSCSIRVLSAVIATFFLAASSFAQVDRSGLSGTITDASGGRVARTHITAAENATGLRRETVSDARGNYTIPELPVGIYTVTFEQPGFRKVEFVDVKQVIGQGAPAWPG